MTMTAHQFAWYLALNETPGTLGTKPCLRFSGTYSDFNETQSLELLWHASSSQCQWNFSRKQKHPKNIMQPKTSFLKKSSPIIILPWYLRDIQTLTNTLLVLHLSTPFHIETWLSLYVLAGSSWGLTVISILAQGISQLIFNNTNRGCSSMATQQCNITQYCHIICCIF